MPKLPLKILLAMILVVTPLLGQEDRPRLKRMSKAELATFLHDLSHDLPNWQARVNQYRAKLDSRYSWDSMLAQAFRMMDESVSWIQSDLADLTKGETLMTDVSLNSNLQLFAGDLDAIEDFLSGAPPTREYSSPTLEPIAMLWAHTTLDVKREVHNYSARLHGHTLAAAHEADLSLLVGCGNAGAAKRVEKH